MENFCQRISKHRIYCTFPGWGSAFMLSRFTSIYRSNKSKEKNKKISFCLCLNVSEPGWISHCFFAITIRDSLRWKSYGTLDISCVITPFLWFTVRCWFLGNTIISIKSVFSDCQNDRIWEFGCGYNAASTTRGRCHWDHGYVNDPKKGIIFKCPNDGFIAGNRPRPNLLRRHNWSVVHSEVTTFCFCFFLFVLHG